MDDDFWSAIASEAQTAADASSADFVARTSSPCSRVLASLETEFSAVSAVPGSTPRHTHTNVRGHPVPKYDLSHLTQPTSQNVLGPIQDDEALLLYSLVRCNRMRTIVEVGGLHGYSALNFVRALDYDGEPAGLPPRLVYTIECRPMDAVGVMHRVIHKDARDVTRADLDGAVVDLLFFDAHDAGAQMALFDTLQSQGAIDVRTMVALHDTNLHFSPHAPLPCSSNQSSSTAKLLQHFNKSDSNQSGEAGFAHQPVERAMVNLLKARGYDAHSVRTRACDHSAKFPYRHGLTLFQRFVPT